VEQLVSEAFVRTLSASIIGRQRSFLADSTAQSEAALSDRFRGRRVLVLGGAGFIATQTVRFLLSLEPAYVGLVDLSENGLAESIRAIRSSELAGPGTVVEPWLADIASPSFRRVLDSVGPVDQLMNFAAVKHVRSERDLPSLLRMLEVNVLGTHRAARAVAETSPQAHQFVVSTDKAADPANFMGASKRAMELAARSACPAVTTARFANVAFSSGSLLESWLLRLANGQPLAVPRDTWRYFVTPEESGQLCSLASIAPAASVAVPDFDEDHLVELEVALAIVLAAQGRTAHDVTSIAEGMALLADDPDPDAWPVLVTARDTAGEKEAEVFAGSAERSEPWLPGLRRLPIGPSSDAVDDLLDRLAEWTSRAGDGLTVEDVQRALAAAVPNFSHIDATARLDDRA
jgi:nucleoside-diphosphate-sugar epimerase